MIDKSKGDSPGCLQEHSIVGYKDVLYVFGGEVGFSNGVETPLWMYHINVSFKNNTIIIISIIIYFFVDIDSGRFEYCFQYVIMSNSHFVYMS